MPRMRQERKGGSQARERASGEEEGGKKGGAEREGDVSSLLSVFPAVLFLFIFFLCLCVVGVYRRDIFF